MEKIIQVGSLNFWTESFGDPAKPAMILIMGVAGQGVMWSDSFCESLAKDFFVIRYDHRDVGQSSHLNYMLKPYGMRDMANDLIGILDGYSIGKAHLVGSSMGGYLAQICMQLAPARLLSVALLMSTVDFSSMSKAMIGTLSPNDLPARTKEVLSGLKEIGNIDTSNFDIWLSKSLSLMRLLSGSETEFVESEWISLLERAYGRRNQAATPSLMHNHVMACSQGPISFYDVKPACPVLVIHGSADPMLPVAHAEKTAKHYDAELKIIEGMGHARSKIFEDCLVVALQQFCGKIC
jgi:pimeloyl-ACP methyl ester carboxylesterase